MAASGHRRVRFEQLPSRIVFDPSSRSFVVSWSKCRLPGDKRLAARKDPASWVPSVSAVCSLYDRGAVSAEQVVSAAMAVGRAYAMGDRGLLDTEGARKAAELVGDLSSMCSNPDSPSVVRDVGQAMRHLLDEIAEVRFSIVPPKEMEEDSALPPLRRAASECLSVDGFVSWTPSSMRRRFMYCLKRRERTPTAYTLISLLFDSGSCPLLSLHDSRMLRMRAVSESGIGMGFTPETICSFFAYALGRMREAKAEGRSSVYGRITQQQLADSLSGVPRLN